jgi:hypothetical protein
VAHFPQRGNTHLTRLSRCQLVLRGARGAGMYQGAKPVWKLKTTRLFPLKGMILEGRPPARQYWKSPPFSSQVEPSQVRLPREAHVSPGWLNAADSLARPPVLTPFDDTAPLAWPLTLAGLRSSFGWNERHDVEMMGRDDGKR